MRYSTSRPHSMLRFLAGVVFCWGFGFSYANAQTFQHLCIEGIEGDSTISGYEGCILLTTYQQTLAPSNKSKYAACEVVVKKNIGIDSPAILMHIATNQLFPSVIISFSSGESIGEEYFRVEMAGVLGESVIVTAESGGGVGDRLNLEEIVFIPATISITYSQPNGGEPQQTSAFIECEN